MKRKIGLAKLARGFFLMSERIVRLLREGQKIAASVSLTGAARRNVASALCRMMGGGKVVLLEGPAGCGKSCIVKQACSSLGSGDKALVAVVRGRSLPVDHDESLQVLLEAVGAKARSRAEARQALTHQLAELKKQGKDVLLVLHDCEVWASSPKYSSMLYMLLDLMQDPDMSYCLILTTRTQDFVDRLEKRVQSRLGSQRLVMPPLTLEDAESIVRQTLTVRGLLDDETNDWNARVERLDLRAAVMAIHRLHCSNVRLFEMLAWLVLGCNLNVDEAWETMRVDVWKARLESLSEVEMCVLISMIRPVSGGCPTSLDEAYDLYKKQLELANERVVPKKLFERAYCGLAEVCDFREYPLIVLEQVLEEDDRYEGNKWPTYISKFMKGFA